MDVERAQTLSMFSLVLVWCCQSGRGGKPLRCFYFFVIGVGNIGEDWMRQIEKVIFRSGWFYDRWIRASKEFE